MSLLRKRNAARMLIAFLLAAAMQILALLLLKLLLVMGFIAAWNVLLELWIAGLEIVFAKMESVG